MSNPNTLRTIVITGANRGIGYAIIEKLLKGKTPYNIVLGARNVKLGAEAQSRLSQEYSSSPSRVQFHQLDISDPSSIDNFINWVKTDGDGKIDILVNNAGIGSMKETPELRINTINTNFFNTVRLTEEVLPVLSRDGKIITVSSTLGLLSFHGPKIVDILQDPTLTREKLFETANLLLKKTKEGTHTELGWYNNTYCATKALLNAYTRWILVNKLKEDQQAYLAHPGWCQTDMGGPEAPDSVESGAETPVYLINLPFKADTNLNGKFFEKCEPRDF